MPEALSRSRQERTRMACSCSSSPRDMDSAFRSQKDVSVSVARAIASLLHPLSAGSLVLFGRRHRLHCVVVFLQELLEVQVECQVRKLLGVHDAYARHLEVLLHLGFELPLQVGARD